MTTSWLSDYLTLHAYISVERRNRGLTQAQAGELIDVCERSYRDFETGRGDLPAARIFRLADALGIRIQINGANNGVG